MIDHRQLVSELAQLALAQHRKIATAESCTGGGIAFSITDISGSSEWFERGFVTYSNEAKQELLGVRSATLAQFGAVSDQAAREMASGALQHSHADLTVSVTGIAGPTGGTDAKPVGTVWFGLASGTEPVTAHHQLFHGDRTSIRDQSIQFALTLLKNALS